MQQQAALAVRSVIAADEKRRLRRKHLVAQREVFARLAAVLDETSDDGIL